MPIVRLFSFLFCRRIRRAIDGYKREMATYNAAVVKALYYEEVVSVIEGDVEYDGSRGVLYRAGWIWKRKLRNIVFKLLSVLAAALSIQIVLAQCSIVARGNLRFFSIIFVFATTSAAGSTFMLLLLLLSYTCICCYYTLFSLARFEFNILVVGHTQGFSMASNALLVCRISSPIAFNFINMAHVKNTAFDRNIGNQIDSTPILGKGFNDLLPFILLPYMAIVACGFFNTVASFLTRSPNLAFKEDYDLLGSAPTLIATGSGGIRRANADSDTESDPIVKRGYELIAIEKHAMETGGTLGAHVDIAASRATTSSGGGSGSGLHSRGGPMSSTSAPNFERAKSRAREAAARVHKKNSLGMTSPSRPMGGSSQRGQSRPIFSFLSGDQNRNSDSGEEVKGLLD